MNLAGDVGVFGCRAATGEEEGVDGPLKDARRLLIVGLYAEKEKREREGWRNESGG